MNLFQDLRTVTSEDPFSGYRGFSSYPVAYQATEFPQYGHEIRITGNNQAFFFVSGLKDSGSNQITDVQSNTTHLRKLIKNILSQGNTPQDRPLVRLQIDADVFENPQRFVGKYQNLRSESEQAERERLLGKEATLIRDFVNNGGLVTLVKEAFQQRAIDRQDPFGQTEEKIDRDVRDFLVDNLRLEGVRTTRPLNFATWEIKSPEGTFAARQEYKTSTYMVDRSWQVGTEPELTCLAQQNHSGAQQIQTAVGYTRNLEIVDLTLGMPATRNSLPASTFAKSQPTGTN